MQVCESYLRKLHGGGMTSWATDAPYGASAPGEGERLPHSSLLPRQRKRPRVAYRTVKRREVARDRVAVYRPGHVERAGGGLRGRHRQVDGVPTHRPCGIASPNICPGTGLHRPRHRCAILGQRRCDCARTTAAILQGPTKIPRHVCGVTTTAATTPRQEE